MQLAYHLVAEAWFRAQPLDEPYRPEGFEREGFVHLTHGVDATIAAGNRHYRADQRPYLLLTVDLSSAGAEVRYEDPDQRFPHAYGPLRRASIVAVHRVNRGPDGVFLNVGGALPEAATETGTGTATETTTGR